MYHTLLIHPNTPGLPATHHLRPRNVNNMTQNKQYCLQIRSLTYDNKTFQVATSQLQIFQLLSGGRALFHRQYRTNKLFKKDSLQLEQIGGLQTRRIVRTQNSYNTELCVHLADADKTDAIECLPYQLISQHL